jgi:hypothetical protein
MIVLSQVIGKGIHILGGASVPDIIGGKSLTNCTKRQILSPQALFFSLLFVAISLCICNGSPLNVLLLRRFSNNFYIIIPRIYTIYRFDLFVSWEKSASQPIFRGFGLQIAHTHSCMDSRPY